MRPVVTARLEHTHILDWPAIAMENEALRLVVIPELGGKIVSLKSRRTGREWLWSNPHLPLTKPPHNPPDFGHYDSGGWDEIFPTVDPCNVPGSAWGERRLTDHGELWYRSWEVIEARIQEDKMATLTLAVDSVELPFQFVRTLSLDAELGTLQVDYRVANHGDLLMPYIWAAHPLVAIRPGDEIVLPPDTLVSSTGSVGLCFTSDSLPFVWPILKLASGESLDLSRISDCSTPFAVKLFAENMTPLAVEIADHSGQERLQFSFTSPVAYCGLWLNCGGWSGADTENYFNLGVEPTTSPNDSLATAYGRDRASAVSPSSSQIWRMSVSVC